MTYFETNPSPLFVADFDYFRLPHVRWPLMLTRLKQMGIEALFITIPWGFHEIERGVIDLSGASDARRDLLGLLQSCETLDLRCLLHLGPYNDSGLLGEGLPMWLLETNHTGEALTEAVKNWYQAVSKPLIKQQWSDGPIVAIQLDSKADDGRARGLSQQLTEVKWPIWLRKRYHGIDALNEAYGTDYRTVSNVPFPDTWADESTPLEKDAKAFLEESDEDTRGGYLEALVEAGWHVPIYPSATEPPANQPPLQRQSLVDQSNVELPPADSPAIVHLQQPIQVEPDSPALSAGLVWAENAPIRADGSLRRKFWAVRQALWGQRLPNSHIEDGQLIVAEENELLVTASGDTLLKVETAVDSKTPVYRLRFNGDLIPDDTLKISRKKLSGLYQAEDEVSQTDWVWSLPDEVALEGLPLAYLRTLLAGQMLSLQQAATQAEALSHTLSVEGHRPPAKPPASQPSPGTSYMLNEARRGLREADTALRKAMASIGQLEGGFSTMLSKKGSPESRPAPEPVVIDPQAFEGKARDLLLEIGEGCYKVARVLTATVNHLQQMIDSDLTIKQYRQVCAEMAMPLQSTHTLLLKHIALLRLELASEELPLVLWRVHDQVQAIAESLRWGAVRQG